MSDDDPKPGVVIDVDPEPADRSRARKAGQPSGGGTEIPKSRQARGSGRLALAVGILAVLGVTGLAGVGVRQVQQLDARFGVLEGDIVAGERDREALQQAVAAATDAINRQRGTLDEQQAVLARHRQAVDAARTAFEVQEQRLADENFRLQEREAQLRAAVADVHRRVGRSGSEWIVEETEYLLRIAIHRLNLARDTETARVALELADQRLRDTKDPGWAGVREQLARDIAAIGAFDAPDLAGLAARLGAAVEQVPQLTLSRAAIGPERTLPERPPRDRDARSWDTLLDDLWAGFKGAVRIRERDQPVAAMLAPEQQFFLYENLKLRLEAARLGLSRGDRELYWGSLDTATQWMAEYFIDDAVSTSLKATVASLRAVDVTPDLPDIGGSLRALELRRQLLGDIVPPDTAAMTSTPTTATPAP